MANSKCINFIRNLNSEMHIRILHYSEVAAHLPPIYNYQKVLKLDQIYKI